MSYKTKVVRKRPLGEGYEKTVKITKENGKPLDTNDIFKVYDLVRHQAKDKNAKYLIRALGVERMFTFKKYYENKLTMKQFEEYYEGNVKDPQKFDKFDYVEITIQD